MISRPYETTAQRGKYLSCPPHDKQRYCGTFVLGCLRKTCLSSPPEYRFTSRPNQLERTRISILSWNPGPRRGTPGAIEKHIAGKWHTIAFQEAIEYLQHDSLTNSFHVSQYAGCAVLFNKDTLYPDVRVSSVYINDTKNGRQQVVREGEAGWVFLAAVSRAAFRRVLRNSTPFFTMMSLRINNHYAKRRGIAKNVFIFSPYCFVSGTS